MKNELCNQKKSPTESTMGKTSDRISTNLIFCFCLCISSLKPLTLTNSKASTCLKLPKAQQSQQLGIRNCFQCGVKVISFLGTQGTQR